MSAAAAQEMPASAQLLQMVMGRWVATSICAVAELGVADHLSSGPKTITDLAAATGSHERSLYRVMRALASVGVFVETGPHTFAMTPLADALRSDSPDSLRSMIRFFGSPLALGSWQQLLHCIQTGETGMRKAFGVDAFEYLREHKDEAAVFNAAMTNFSRREGPAIADAYDFSQFRKIVDVAGGHGSLLLTVLQKYVGPRGVLFDLPQVIEGGRRAISDAGMADRCETASGSFFESVPEGADCYMMKHIIHDWDEPEARTILMNCRKAIQPGGKLLLIEIVIPEGNDPSFGKLLDLEMLVIPGGRERTEAEYAELFASAGFQLTEIVPTRAPVSVIEARPV